MTFNFPHITTLRTGFRVNHTAPSAVTVYKRNAKGRLVKIGTRTKKGARRG